LEFKYNVQHFVLKSVNMQYAVKNCFVTKERVYQNTLPLWL